MSILIEYPSTSKPLFLGRNGCFAAKGVHLSVAGAFVRLEPLTAKGKIGRCSIEIPNDPAILRAVADTLNKMAEGLAW